ncbi:MAG: hypothetical protein FGM49_00090 [Candidatus Nanopelagicaceae bacterium]|jgi:hypothetical protein|nr:hypothetical protein [Candidatus Nanopelagicaceae bacterium]
MFLQLATDLTLALNEDGSMPGEPMGFLEGFVWFVVVPVGISLFVWVSVVAQENWKRAKSNRTKQDVITRINE